MWQEISFNFELEMELIFICDLALLGKKYKNYFPRPVECKKLDEIRKIIKQSQKNTRFMLFTTKGYVHRVAANFTRMKKIIQEAFTIHIR